MALGTLWVSMGHLEGFLVMVFPASHGQASCWSLEHVSKNHAPSMTSSILIYLFSLSPPSPQSWSSCLNTLSVSGERWVFFQQIFTRLGKVGAHSLLTLFPHERVPWPPLSLSYATLWAVDKRNRQSSSCLIKCIQISSFFLFYREL